MKKYIVFLSLALALCVGVVSAQPQRIAVLPFRNMDGNLALNTWCAKLSDSIAAGLRLRDTSHTYYFVVSQDSVAETLATLNLDPTNPQYESDLWKAVSMLNITRVITGNFNVEYGKMLINCYNYDVETKIPNPVGQARNLFKPLDKPLETVPTIINKMLLGLIPKQ
jgi:hypothetical protein